MLYYKSNKWNVCEYKIKYIQDDKEIEQYVLSEGKQWWLDFEQKWSSIQIIEFTPVQLTEEQLLRYNDIINMPEDFGNIYSEYVDSGNIIEELRDDHPFKLIILQNNMKKVNNNLFPIIDKTNLEEYKLYRINESKVLLEEYLKNNPLLYNGDLYSVTQEKQALLTSAISAYQLKVDAGIPAVLKWNTTGDICREWTLEQIAPLVAAITEYVQPRVEKQQDIEVQIKNCTTVDQLNLITIDYSII